MYLNPFNNISILYIWCPIIFVIIIFIGLDRWRWVDTLVVLGLRICFQPFLEDFFLVELVFDLLDDLFLLGRLVIGILRIFLLDLLSGFGFGRFLLHLPFLLFLFDEGLFLFLPFFMLGNEFFSVLTLPPAFGLSQHDVLLPDIDGLFEPSEDPPEAHVVSVDFLLHLFLFQLSSKSLENIVDGRVGFELIGLGTDWVVGIDPREKVLVVQKSSDFFPVEDICLGEINLLLGVAKEEEQMDQDFLMLNYTVL